MTLKLAINGSPSRESKTASLAGAWAALVGGEVLHLADIDAGALLFRSSHRSLEDALSAVAEANVLLLATPIYRGTYTGILKLLLDHMPLGGLEGKAIVLAGTAASPAHYLGLDCGLRPVVASLGGWSTPRVIYATDSDFDADRQPGASIVAALKASADELAQFGWAPSS